MSSGIDSLRRLCSCGSVPELVGSMNTKTCFVRCPNCGARSITCSVPSAAWRAWDASELETDKENFTLWELM
jgi:hypothetical protein